MAITQRIESQFSAGTACEPCQVMGHFCPAQDFNASDDPACASCLKGVTCATLTVREPKSREFEKAEEQQPLRKPQPAPRSFFTKALNKQPAVKQGPPPPRMSLALEAPEVEEEPVAVQAAITPALCAYCHKARHSGVCRERRAATAEARDYVSLGEEPRTTAQRELAEKREAIDKLFNHPKAAEILNDPENQPAIMVALGLPTFEVVPRAQVPGRSHPAKYDTLIRHLKTLGPDDTLKMTLSSETEAARFAKNSCKGLHRKVGCRVSCQRHGTVIFFFVRHFTPTSKTEVSQ